MESLSLSLIAPGGTNPRKHFDADALAELTDSVRRHGVLQPVLVRPWPAGKARGAVAAKADAYELVAGERRLRAAKAAGLAEIPALVRDLTDGEVLEIQVVENLQRQDLHPLEEADGYRQLRAAGYDVARIAERVGRSVAYVYDRLRLANLTDEARGLFAEDRITAGHAVLLARLTPEQQATAIEHRDGLFQPEMGLFPEPTYETVSEAADSYADPAPHQAIKPRSVRELQAWIDTHCKLDADKQVDLEQLFPGVAAALQVSALKEGEERVVQITHQDYVQPTARDGSRIIGPRSWREAEKPCDYMATGVIVVGPGRGETLTVCVEKKKCAVHWGAEIRAAKKEAKAREAGASGATVTKAKDVEDKWEAERRRREEKRVAWEKAAPAILKALASSILAARPAAGPIADVLLQTVGGYEGDRRGAEAGRYVPQGKTAEDLLRHLAFLVLAQEGAEYNAHEAFPQRLKKLFGLDLRPVLKAAAKEAPPAAPKKAKRKAAAA